MAASVSDLVIMLFLWMNLSLRFNALYNYTSWSFYLLLAAGVSALAVRLRPNILLHLFFVLGLTLPLYGFQSYTPQNCFFEFLISLLGSLLLWQGRTEKEPSPVFSTITFQLGGFVILASLSLLLLPVLSLLQTLKLWGFLDFSNALCWATPENPLYSLAAGNRLILFFVFVLLLSRSARGDQLFRRLFTGCAWSVIVACILGLLCHFHLLSLTWYRPVFETGLRMHSVFGNPGWFAKYVIVCIPFMLLMLERVKSLQTRLMSLSAILSLIAVCLLLTGSRTSWLAFVILMIFCYVFVLFFGTSQVRAGVSRQAIMKMVGKAVLCLLIIILAAGSILMVSNRYNCSASGDGSYSQAGYILHRFKKIADRDDERFKIWQETAAIIRESPVVGLGYESYRWHQGVMGSIPESLFSQSRQTKNNWDTTHNLYVQLLVSVGVLGLLFWLILVFRVAGLLWRDGVLLGNHLSLILFGVLIAFHLYGFAQSMIYVSSIWIIFFLVVGYAVRVERMSSTGVSIDKKKYVLAFVAVAVTIGAIAYMANMQSRHLAQRYDLPRYERERGADHFFGFFPKEDWGKDGYFRWSGRRGKIVLGQSGVMELDFVCNTPRLDREPVIMKIVLNDQVLENVAFHDGKKVVRKLTIPVREGNKKNVIRLELSRTWIPVREKTGKDTRVLGVAVSEPRYL